MKIVKNRSIIFSENCILDYDDLRPLIYEEEKKEIVFFNTKGITKKIYIDGDNFKIEFPQNNKEFSIKYKYIHGILKQFVDNYVIINIINERKMTEFCDDYNYNDTEILDVIKHMKAYYGE